MDWQTKVDKSPSRCGVTHFSLPTTSKGFTLLEAIVALVLIATTGMALLNWVNTNFITLQRVKDSQQRQEAVRSALVFMDSVNPMEEPQGEKTVGVYHYKWESRTVHPPKSGVQSTGALSIFEIGLYDVDIQVSAENQSAENQLVARLTLRQVGFKQVFAAPSEEDF